MFILGLSSFARSDYSIAKNATIPAGYSDAVVHSSTGFVLG